MFKEKAMTAAGKGSSFRNSIPSEPSPKKIMNNCTNRGVPLIADTYTLAIPLKIEKLDSLANAVNTAITNPKVNDMSVRGIE